MSDIPSPECRQAPSGNEVSSQRVVGQDARNPLRVLHIRWRTCEAERIQDGRRKQAQRLSVNGSTLTVDVDSAELTFRAYRL
ncbi:hypothetical protein [Streptomyces sp. NPDC002559]